MRAARARRALAATIGAAAVSASGCGGGGGGETTTARPASEPAPSATAIEILAPDEGSTVRGQTGGTGAIEAPVTVTGHADALQVVRVDGRCKAASCTKFAYTGAQGRWTAKLRLVVPPRARHWKVTADYAVSPAPATGATLTLDVRASKARAPSRGSRSRREAEPGGGATQTQPPAGSTTTTTPTTPSATTPGPSSGAGGTLVLVGDSLAVGVRDLLPAALPNWNVQVLARTGRPLAEGMGVLSSLDLSGSGGRRAVLAVSLFTNDDPTHTSALEAAVRRTLATVGSNGCVIWATIARPPVNGTAYRAANAVLARLAADDPRLRLVPWAEQVAADPKLVGADGVHPTPAGYRVRAQLYAQAAQSCA